MNLKLNIHSCYILILSVMMTLGGVSTFGKVSKSSTVVIAQMGHRGPASLNQCSSHFSLSRKTRFLNFVKSYGPSFGLRAAPFAAILPFADNYGVFAANLGKATQVINDFSIDQPQAVLDVVQNTYQTLGQGTGVDEALIAAGIISASLNIIDESADRFLDSMARLNPGLVLVFASILTNAPELGVAIMSAIKDGVIETAAATPIGSNFYNPTLLLVAVVGMAFMKAGHFAPLFKKALNQNVREQALAQGLLEDGQDISELNYLSRIRLQFRSFAGSVANQIRRGRRELGVMSFSILSAASFFGLVVPGMEQVGNYNPLYLWMALTSPFVYQFFVKPVSSIRGQVEGLADAADEEEISGLLEELRDREAQVSSDDAREDYHSRLIDFIESVQGYNESSEGSETFRDQVIELRDSLNRLGEATAIEYAEIFSEVSEDPYLRGIMEKIGVRQPRQNFFKRFKSSFGTLMMTVATGAGIALGSALIDTGANFFVRSQSILDKTGFGAVVNSLLTSLPDATVAASLLGAGMTIGAFRSTRFSNYTNVIISYIAISTVLLL